MELDRSEAKKLVKNAVRTIARELSNTRDLDAIRFRVREINDCLEILEREEREERIDRDIEKFTEKVEDSKNAYYHVVSTIERHFSTNGEATIDDLVSSLNEKFPKLKYKDSTIKQYVRNAVRYLREKGLVYRTGTTYHYLSRDHPNCRCSISGEESRVIEESEEEDDEDDEDPMEEIKDRNWKDYETLRNSIE